MDNNQQQPQPLNFDDLGAKTVTPVSSPASSPAKLDFSDLGAKTVSPNRAPSAVSPIAPPQFIVGSPASRPMSQVDALGNPQGGYSMMGAPAAPEAVVPSGAGADVAAHTAMGMTKGAAQTLHTAAALGSRAIPGVPNVPFAEPAELQTHGTAEGVGAGLEGIGEFILGDAALKGLPLLQRAESALKAQKALKVAAGESPLVQQILSLGLKAVRTAGVSGGQSFLHEPTPASAGTGAALGVGGEVTSEAASYGISKLIPRTLEAATTAAKEGVADAASQRQASARELGNIATRTTSDITGNVIPDADNFRDAANEVRSTFNPTYDKLREATGGVLNQSTGRYSANAFDDATQQIARAKKVIYSASPASTDALKTAENELADGEGKLQQLFDSGTISQTERDSAKAGWRKAATLDDLHGYIDKAFSEPAGVRQLSGNAPEVDPKQFVRAANKAIDSLGAAKLTDAMGPENFKDLQAVRSKLASAINGENYGQALNQAARKYLAQQGVSSGTALRATGAGGSLAVLAHFLGASNPAAATIGGTAGVVRWLYDHPDQGVKVLGLVEKNAPLAAQAAKQAVGGSITHIYDPESQIVTPANQ